MNKFHKMEKPGRYVGPPRLAQRPFWIHEDVIGRWGSLEGGSWTTTRMSEGGKAFFVNNAHSSKPDEMQILCDLEKIHFKMTPQSFAEPRRTTSLTLLWFCLKNVWFFPSKKWCKTVCTKHWEIMATRISPKYKTVAFFDHLWAFREKK